MKLGARPARLPTVVSAFLMVSCETGGLQRQDQFAWAIHEAGSTSPPIVRIRLLDEKNSDDAIRCLFSDILIDAIIAEMSLPNTPEGYQQAISFALASRAHSFRFVKPASRKLIATARGTVGAELAKGCELIRQGHSALWADMQATVVKGPQFPASSDTR